MKTIPIMKIVPIIERSKCENCSNIYWEDRPKSYVCYECKLAYGKSNSEKIDFWMNIIHGKLRYCFKIVGIPDLDAWADRYLNTINFKLDKKRTPLQMINQGEGERILKYLQRKKN